MLQRKIRPADLEWAGYRRAPQVAKPTAVGLWLYTDATGGIELDPPTIADLIEPGMSPTVVEEHLLMLEESGFLVIFPDRGSWWVSLVRPLAADMRKVDPATLAPTFRDRPRPAVAMERERERGGERVSARERAEAIVRAEGAARAWDRVESAERVRLVKPERPVLMDAPPLGCPEHPNNTAEVDCRACAVARNVHAKYVEEERHLRRMTRYVESMG